MSLKQQIMADVKSAMKSKEADKLAVLRFLHSAIKNREIEVRPNEISEADVQAVIKKLVKQHKDSIEQFEKANRQDLADKEKFELGVLESYLPEQLGQEQVEAAVTDAIAAMGATSMKDMGAVMKEVLAKTGGQADGKMVSEMVKSKLQ